jgi:hypothetical protein
VDGPDISRRSPRELGAQLFSTCGAAPMAAYAPFPSAVAAYYGGVIPSSWWSNGTCPAGSGGPFCLQCAEGYFRDGLRPCETCDAAGPVPLLLAIAMGAVAIVLFSYAIGRLRAGMAASRGAGPQSVAAQDEREPRPAPSPLSPSSKSWIIQDLSLMGLYAALALNAPAVLMRFYGADVVGGSIQPVSANTTTTTTSQPFPSSPLMATFLPSFFILPHRHHGATCNMPLPPPTALIIFYATLPFALALATPLLFHAGAHLHAKLHGLPLPPTNRMRESALIWTSYALRTALPIAACGISVLSFCAPAEVGSFLLADPSSSCIDPSYMQAREGATALALVWTVLPLYGLYPLRTFLRVDVPSVFTWVFVTSHRSAMVFLVMFAVDPRSWSASLTLLAVVGLVGHMVLKPWSRPALNAMDTLLRVAELIWCVAIGIFVVPVGGSNSPLLPKGEDQFFPIIGTVVFAAFFAFWSAAVVDAAITKGVWMDWAERRFLVERPAPADAPLPAVARPSGRRRPRPTAPTAAPLADGPVLVPWYRFDSATAAPLYVGMGPPPPSWDQPSPAEHQRSTRALPVGSPHVSVRNLLSMHAATPTGGGRVDRGRT